MLWPDISRVGRIPSDVVRGISVTKFIGVGHIAILKREKSGVEWTLNGSYMIQNTRYL